MSTTNHPVVSGISEQDLQTLIRFYNAFAGQPDVLDECVTPDWQDIPLAPGQASGREGMKPLIKGFGAVFDDLKVEVLDVIGGPGRAAVRAVSPAVMSPNGSACRPPGASSPSPSTSSTHSKTAC